MKTFKSDFIRGIAAVACLFAVMTVAPVSVSALDTFHAADKIVTAWRNGPGLIPLADSAQAVSGASAQTTFLGFKSKTAFHRFSGWTSAGLLAAAGIVGTVHAYDLMSGGHEYRDLHHIDEDSIGSECSGEISDLWGGQTEQILRWTHVGLLAVGESLYLANAITGIGFINPERKSVPASTLHRWAFFIHATLMLSEAVTGYFTSMALAAGNHELVRTLGVAHAAVGLAIPAVMIGAGIIVDSEI